jgi:PAS domain S-box-containing protein
MLKHQKSNKPTTASELRAHAEDRLRYKPETNAVLSYSKDELLRLNHELSVHQIELEMQADELRYSSDLLALSNADLEASFSQYADLYEFAPSGYLTLALDSTILQVNLTATKMFGVSRSLLKGNRFITFVSVADQATITKMIADVFLTTEHQFCEVTLISDENHFPGLHHTFSGHTIRIDATLSPDSTECRAIIIDITESKKAAIAALELSEERHSSLFKHMLNGIAYCKMIYSDGRPVDFLYEQVNLRFETQTGLKNVEGKKFSEIIAGTPDPNTELLELYGRVAASGKPERFEVYIDAMKMWFEGSAYTLQSDHFVAIFDNITERKLAELALKKLSVTVEQNPSMVVITDAHGAIEFVNASFTETTGYTLEDVKGKNPRLFKSGITPKALYDELWQTILSGNVWRGELQNTKNNGELYWESEVISPVLDTDGKIINLVGIKQDITAQKRLLSELSVAKEKVKEAELLKAAFMANISHELRSPVSGILGFSELLKSPDLSKEELLEYNDLIFKSGERMLHLINDLVDYSRIEAGESMLQISTTSVNQVMSDIAAFFTHEVDRQKLRISFTAGLPDSKSIIDTDGSKLHQILTNLIQNAIKFTTSGAIEFGYTEKNKMLHFYVRDSGIGIPLAMQVKIFERFRQVDNKLTQHYKGSGLGLSISKAYVELLGGTIRVESEEGKGSTFIFTLPYNPIHNAVTNPNETLSAAKDSVLRTQHSALSSTILIVEDDDASRYLLQKMLKNESMNILYANNGREGVDMVEDHPEIKLVLMDLKMPIMNGFEATKLIKQKHPELPIIAQSAFSSLEVRRKASEAGCSALISKPIKKDELLEKMHEMLEKKPELHLW